MLKWQNSIKNILMTTSNDNSRPEAEALLIKKLKPEVNQMIEDEENYENS